MITLIAAYVACIALLIILLLRAPAREDIGESNYESELAESLHQQSMARLDSWSGVDSGEDGVRSPTVPFDSTSHGTTADRNAG